MAEEPTADLEILTLFSEINQEQNNEDNEITNKSESKKFWESFKDALDLNVRGHDGQQRILSIIAESFTYSQLYNNLSVRFWNKFSNSYFSIDQTLFLSIG